MAPAETALAAGPRRLRLPALLRAGLIGATVGTVALNASQTVLGSLSTVTLTNVLGARGFGAYSFAFTWATLLTIPSVLGMTPLVIRYVAAYRERAAWGHLRGIVRRVNQVVGLSACAVAAVAACAGWFALAGRPEMRTPFVLAMLLVPVISLVTMRQATMTGLSRVVLGRLPDTVVAPATLLILLLGAAVAIGHYSATAAIAMQLTSVALGLAIGVVLLRRVLPNQARRARPEYETGAWARGGRAMLLASIAIALEGQLGTLVLGSLKSSAATGVFAASVRLAALSSFLYLAASYPLMPALARLQVNGQFKELERVALRAARVVSLLSIPIMCIVVALAPTVLGLLGPGFAAGTTTLRILLVGEIFRQVTGFGGSVLLMSGRERVFAKVAVAVTALNLVMALALVPVLGAEGAAIATTIAVILQNVWMLIAVWQETHVWTAALPLPRRFRRAGSENSGPPPV